MKQARDSGETMIEFALSLSIFMLLLLGSIDFANLFYTKMTLQNAVRQAGRYAITGQCIVTGGTCSLNRYSSIISTLRTASNHILTSNNASEVVVTCVNNGGGCPNLAGGPGDVITITVTHKYNFMTAPIAHFFTGGSYNLVVSTTFNNEPFPPSQS